MLAPFFHEDSGLVRFWVPIARIAVGAAVSRETLHRFGAPPDPDDDPLRAFHANQARLEEAVRRRVAAGAIEPVTIRDADLGTDRAGA